MLLEATKKRVFGVSTQNSVFSTSQSLLTRSTLPKQSWAHRGALTVVAFFFLLKISLRTRRLKQARAKARSFIQGKDRRYSRPLLKFSQSPPDQEGERREESVMSRNGVTLPTVLLSSGNACAPLSPLSHPSFGAGWRTVVACCLNWHDFSFSSMYY